MANVKQAGVRRLKMAERAQHAMNELFPNFPVEWLWRRKHNDGYSTIPRTLPIVMQAIDAESKGQPAGHTLFCLWARAPDHWLVTVENPATFAAEAGFSGERAVDTWRKRMKKLRELQMIETQEGPTGEFHYVLLLNPNVAMEYLRQNKQVQDGLYVRFKSRLMDVGGYADLENYDAYCARIEAEKKKAEEAAAATKVAAAAAAKPPDKNDSAPAKVIA